MRLDRGVAVEAEQASLMVSSANPCFGTRRWRVGVWSSDRQQHFAPLDGLYPPWRRFRATVKGLPPFSTFYMNFY